MVEKRIEVGKLKNDYWNSFEKSFYFLGATICLIVLILKKEFDYEDKKFNVAVFSFYLKILAGQLLR
ncbi:hypothetical protein [Candidatus Arsenophonus triatominarum]|uniref:hypothetical protein n=1 Tax=Candidatus Arsenophonus triatominarum TaxID=57911 RepID=UPI00139676FD|nr:hypothetical protein [Candidatus Arsenophonus triatominarum]